MGEEGREGGKDMHVVSNGISNEKYSWPQKIRMKFKYHYYEKKIKH